MVQVRLKLGLWGGGGARQAHMPSYTQTASTVPASIHSIEIFLDTSSLLLAWLPNALSTYSVKRVFIETVKFIPALRSLRPRRPKYPSGDWFSWTWTQMHVFMPRKLVNDLWNKKEFASEFTVITVAWCYPFKSGRMQYSGLKYYLYSVHSLRGSHESISNREDLKQLIKMCRLLAICG